MSGTVGAATARLRLVRAIAVGGVVGLLVPSVSATTVDTPVAVVLAALAVTVAAVVLRGSHRTTPVPGSLAPQPGAAEVAPSFLAERVTDPLHHPLRPRAPGLV